MNGAPEPARALETPALWRRLACFLYEGVLLFGVVMAAGLLYSIATSQRNALQGRLGLVLFLFAVLGSYLAAKSFINKQESFLLLAMSAAALFGFFRFHNSYAAFAWSFAGTVYRDFSALDDCAIGPPP